MKCPYCQGELTARNFSVDHIIPTSRGGNYGWQNLKVCCRSCNRIKGSLTGDELEDLTTATRLWPSFVRANLFARLKCGANIARIRNHN